MGLNDVTVNLLIGYRQDKIQHSFRSMSGDD